MLDCDRPRREFIHASLAAGASLALSSCAMQGRPTSLAEEESWLSGLNGRHRAFFDVDAVRDGILGRVDNFLQTYCDEYGLRDADVSVVFGAHGSGLSFVLNDAIWHKYQLGRFYSIYDPHTGATAVRNIFATMDPSYTWPTDYSISALQKRGVRFLACHSTMKNLARQVEFAALATEDEVIPSQANVLADLQAGVLPGTVTVPAMIVAQNRAQEAGLKYVYVV